MYHRVIPADKLIQPGMYVTPATFECQITFLKKYFNIIPLSSLISSNDVNEVVKNGKPPCILSFDDGWIDFYDYAFPLLVKHQLPATIFLPTSFIGTRKQFWTDCFAYLLYNRKPTILKESIGPEIFTITKYLDSLSGSFANQLDDGIEYLKKYSKTILEDVLTVLSKIWDVDITGLVRNFLNWTEVTEMQESGLISFGSHTVNHQILTTLDDKEIKTELIDSQKQLLQREVINKSSISFCYPNGNHTKQIADAVRLSGYHLAVSTKNGWNAPGSDKFTLKRVGVHEDMTSTTSLFACRIAGLI